jgi:hypothetical protein
MFHLWWDCQIQLYSRFGFRGEGTNYAILTSLNPQHVTIYIDSNSAIREHVTRSLCWAKDLSVQHVDHKQDRAESSHSKLGNKSVTWINHESKIQSNTW